MIAIPRSLVKQFRAVLRRCATPADGRRDPFVVIRSSNKGLTLETVLGDTAVQLEHPGKQGREVLAFRASVLAQFEGRGPDLVAIEEEQVGKGRATWSEAAGPVSHDFNTVSPEKHLLFPEPPGDMKFADDRFQQAMDEASQTASSQITGRSFHLICLRGSTSQIVATDGRQLLIQGGFPFPWKNDLLVPRITVWGMRELTGTKGVMFGQTDDHLFIRLGSWTFALKLDLHGRFPPVEQVVPSPRGIKTQLQLGAEDIALLCTELSRSPGRKDEPSHLMLVIGKEVVVRSHLDDQVQGRELKLTASQVTGQPVSVRMHHAPLVRALTLGFSRIEIVRGNTPLCCRDEKRVYVWMPLTEPTAATAKRQV